MRAARQARVIRDAAVEGRTRAAEAERNGQHERHRPPAARAQATCARAAGEHMGRASRFERPRDSFPRATRAAYATASTAALLAVEAERARLRSDTPRLRSKVSPRQLQLGGPPRRTMERRRSQRASASLACCVAPWALTRSAVAGTRRFIREVSGHVKTRCALFAGRAAVRSAAGVLQRERPRARRLPAHLGGGAQALRVRARIKRRATTRTRVTCEAAGAGSSAGPGSTAAGARAQV